MPTRRIAVFKKLEDLIAFMTMAEAQVVLWWMQDDQFIEITTAIGDGLLLRCRLAVEGFDHWRKEERTKDMTIFEGRVEFAP